VTPLARSALAEFLGSAGLVTVVIGSGIAAQRLSPGDVGLQLLENALATGAGLVALILAFGPVSGGHFNPVVTLADRYFGGVSNREVAAYLPAAYWWSSSTSFADPMIDLARTLSDTFAGIAPSSVPMFLLMQVLGGAIGVAVVAVLYPTVAAVAEDVVVPRENA
jgi:glycerol uptake facilitator-like aquaporin